MKEKLGYFVNLSSDLMLDKVSIFQIGKVLKEKGASLSITVVSLHKVGFTLEEIEDFLNKSPLWKDEPIDLTELFFQYAGLDDDLIV